MEKKILTALALIMALSLIASCSGSTAPSSSPVSYSQYQLEYMLLAKYPDFFWCDPDVYPVAREGQEQQNALQQFPTIQANQAEFSAILEHLGLTQKTDYSDQEKLSIYREYKKLNLAVQMELSGKIYDYTLRVGQGNGYRIEGTVDSYGTIKETSRENSFNSCPICLTRGTLIDTPTGPLPVQQIRQGMQVWTMDSFGNKVAATVIAAASTPVPPSFQVVKITLSDGRTVTTSPGHPSPTGESLGTYQPGDTLDGALVVSVDKISYDGGYTYDILPAGTTGLYWANGILLRSTLFVPPNKGG